MLKEWWEKKPLFFLECSEALRFSAVTQISVTRSRASPERASFTAHGYWVRSINQREENRKERQEIRTASLSECRLQLCEMNASAGWKRRAGFHLIHLGYRPHRRLRFRETE